MQPQAQAASLVHRPVTLALACVAVALIIYSLLPSTHYDPNGLNEVISIESGRLVNFFSPHHLLYRPLGFVLWRLSGLVGYQGPSIFPLQRLSGVFGALGVGVFFLVLRRVSGSDVVALLLSAGYAFSYTYWVHSEDVYYIIIAAFFILLSFLGLLLYRVTGERKHILPLALTSALAVLFWQTNVFFIPVALLGMWTREGDQQDRLKAPLLYAGTCGLLLGGVYMAVGYLVLNCRTPLDFLDWLTTYQTALPIWGVLDLSRAKDVVITFVAAFIPLNKGLGIRRLLQGQLCFEKLLPQLSLMFSGVVVLLISVWVAKNARRFWKAYSSLLILCSVWLALYGVFNMWWDPFEVKWWVIPVVPVWIMLALVLAEVRNSTVGWPAGVATPLAAVAIGVISLANLTAAVVPNHIAPFEEMEIALAFGSYMRPEDLLISADWKWSEYVPYFAHRDVLNIIDISATGREVLSAVDQEIAARSERGARVFLVDLYSYNDDYWAWLTHNTGLVCEDFNQYERRIAWHHQDEVVWEILQE